MKNTKYMDRKHTVGKVGLCLQVKIQRNGHHLAELIDDFDLCGAQTSEKKQRLMN
jgi:hypothetical protein